MSQEAVLIPGRDYVKTLDGIRGLAILLVVVHNASWIEQQSPAFIAKLTIAVTSTWWIGVSLFFVLSGALITGILLDTRSEPTYFRSFYTRRTLRIFPLYYAFLGIAFFVGPYVISNPQWQAAVHANQAWFWIYLQNWRTEGIPGLPHLWSLAVEEQFYLVWPIVVWALPRRWLVATCIAIIATMPLLRWFLVASTALAEGDMYAYTVARWDALAVGALLAIWMQDPANHARLRRLAPRILVGTASSLVLFVLIHRGFHSGDPPVDVVGQSVVAALFGALITTTILPSGALGTLFKRSFSAGWLRFFGTYSYAIYIFHVPIHHTAERYLSTWVNTGGPLLAFAKLCTYNAMVLSSATMLALLSWRLLERPCLRLRDRIAPRIDRSKGCPDASEQHARELERPKLRAV